MYDPEVSLQLEENMKKMRKITSNVRKILGKNHPLLKISKFLDKLTELIIELKNDYDNCFDEKEKADIGREIIKGCEKLEKMASALENTFLDSKT